MMVKKYIVDLSAEERAYKETNCPIIGKRSRQARNVKILQQILTAAAVVIKWVNVCRVTQASWL